MFEFSHLDTLSLKYCDIDYGIDKKKKINDIYKFIIGHWNIGKNQYTTMNSKMH
jgi:hypothetical protein